MMVCSRESNLSDWSGRNVLISGVSGFLGSWVAKKLVEEGANVFGVLRSDSYQSVLNSEGIRERIHIEYGDLSDYRFLEHVINDRSIDSVFHIGAQAIVKKGRRSPYQTFETNIRGTYGILEACRVHQDQVERIVIASSDKAYGYSDQLPYLEDMALCGVDPYEVSKSCTDLIANSYARTYSLPVVVLRCGNIFGGGDLNWDRIFPGIMRSLILGEALEIRSGPKFVRDYTYVHDVVDAYLCAGAYLDQGRRFPNEFNISHSKPISISGLLELCEVELGRPVDAVFREDCEGEIEEQFLDCSLAASQLGWKSQISLADAIRNTHDWYERFFVSRN